MQQIGASGSDVASVDFYSAETLPDRASFGHTGRIEGTVTGSSGDSWQGAVTWDIDESSGWEILNGHLDDAEFFVESGQVQSIEETDPGSRATLRVSRSFRLRGSQDGVGGNRGILIDGLSAEDDGGWFRAVRQGTLRAPPGAPIPIARVSAGVYSVPPTATPLQLHSRECATFRKLSSNDPPSLTARITW